MPRLSQESGSVKFVNVVGAGQLAHTVSGAVARRGRKHFAALRVNVRLRAVCHPLKGLRLVPRNVGLHPSRGPGSLPMPNLLNRLSWRL